MLSLKGTPPLREDWGGCISKVLQMKCFRWAHLLKNLCIRQMFEAEFWVEFFVDRVVQWLKLKPLLPSIKGHEQVGATSRC